MEILEQRKDYVKQVVLLARDSYNITTAFSVGDGELEPEDIRLLFVPREDTDPVAAYKKLNYLLSNDLKPESAETLSRDPSCITKRYTLSDGFVVTVYISGASTAESMDWWRPLFDSAKLVETIDPANRVSEDILVSGQDAPEPPADQPEPEPAAAEPAAVTAPAPAPVFAPLPEPILEPEPQPEPEPEPQPEPEPETYSEEEEIDENEEYWNFVSAQLRSARHAVAAESFIHANEIINVLRKMLIELICVRNGIESDFETAIDYIECEEKDMLIKTYPNAMNRQSFINALSTITALFDRLA